MGIVIFCFFSGLKIQLGSETRPLTNDFNSPGPKALGQRDREDLLRETGQKKAWLSLSTQLELGGTIGSCECVGDCT